MIVRRNKARAITAYSKALVVTGVVVVVALYIMLATGRLVAEPDEVRRTFVSTAAHAFSPTMWRPPLPRLVIRL